MTKTSLLKTAVFSAFLLANAALNAEQITIGATPVPHAEILEFVKPKLKELGYDLDIKVFNDYVLPNKALDEKDLDANFMQHLPYLLEFNKANGTNIKSAFDVHLEPMGAYSKKFKNTNEIKDGAKIAVPNDPTNESRALDLLAKNGLFSLNESVALKTPLDIKDNPRKFEIIELEGATLPRALNDVDIAVINSNFAIDAGLDPLKDTIFTEDGKNNPYANIVATLPEHENSDKTQALKKVLIHEDTKKMINEKYKGAVIPAF